MLKEYQLNESLILKLNQDPRSQYGYNNLRDIIMTLHESGKSPDQIYNILYIMGVEKTTAYDGIQAYLPKNNHTNEMTVQEKIDVKEKLRSLLENIKGSKNTDNEIIKTISAIVENYLVMETKDFGGVAYKNFINRLISELNTYDYIDAVSNCITEIEKSLVENAMSVAVAEAYDELSKSNQNKYYQPVIEKVEGLQKLSESEIREKLPSLSKYNWISEVKTIVEKNDAITGKNSEVKTETLIEKAGLINKLKSLKEELKVFTGDGSDYYSSYAKSVVEKNIDVAYTNKSMTQGQILYKAVSEMKDYEWMAPVKSFVESIQKFVSENVMSLETEAAYKSLSNSKHNSYYKQGEDYLVKIKNLSEEEIKESLKKDTKALSWIPEIKFLVERNNNLDGTLNTNQDGTVIKKFSPVMEHEGGHIFYLSGQTYHVKEGNITPIDANTLTSLYLTLIAVEENFKFDDNTITMYKANQVLKFSINEEDNKTIFELNGKEMNIKESSDLRNILLSSGLFNVNELGSVDKVVKAYENMDKFVELDFVHSIQSNKHKGVEVNVLKTNEAVYVNRINTSSGVNELIKTKDSLHAISLVKEYVDYDVSNLFKEKLDKESKLRAVTESKKAAIMDKIVFLKEQREKLSQEDKSNEFINEADKIIVAEINKFQTELNEIK